MNKVRLLGFLAAWGLALAAPCSTAFYPTDPEMQWRYRSVGDNQTYVQNFAQATGGLLETRRFSGRVEQTRWTCTPQGLRTLPEGEMAIPGGSVRLTRLTGVVIPGEGAWRVGGRWTYRYELEGRIAFVNLTGHLEVENRVVGLEAVEVPAGRFQALKVEADFRGQFGIPLTGRSTYWFVEGVGVVRQVSDTSYAGRSASELVEFRRPLADTP